MAQPVGAELRIKNRKKMNNFPFTTLMTNSFLLSQQARAI